MNRFYFLFTYKLSQKLVLYESKQKSTWTTHHKTEISPKSQGELIFFLNNLTFIQLKKIKVHEYYCFKALGFQSVRGNNTVQTQAN